MGSGHADFADKIVSALKGSSSSNFPSGYSPHKFQGSSHSELLTGSSLSKLQGSLSSKFKHFPPVVPMASGPTTKTLSQHINLQKQTKTDKSIGKDIVNALKEPLTEHPSDRVDKFKPAYKPPTKAPYQGSVGRQNMREEVSEKVSKSSESKSQKGSYETYVTTVKPRRWRKKKRKTSANDIFAKASAKARNDIFSVKDDPGLPDVVASEIVRELKKPQNKIQIHPKGSKIEKVSESEREKQIPQNQMDLTGYKKGQASTSRQRELKKPQPKSQKDSSGSKKGQASGWMSVDTFKIGPPSKTNAFQEEASYKMINISNELDTNQIEPFRLPADSKRMSPTVIAGSKPEQRDLQKFANSKWMSSPTDVNSKSEQNFDESVWKLAQAERTGGRFKQTKPTTAPQFKQTIRTKATMAPYKGTPFFRPVHNEVTLLLSPELAWFLNLVFVLLRPSRNVSTPSFKPLRMMLFREESLLMTMSFFPIGNCVSFVHTRVFVDLVNAGDLVPWYGPIVGLKLVVHLDLLKPKTVDPIKAGDRVP